VYAVLTAPLLVIAGKLARLVASALGLGIILGYLARWLAR
jgi:hypothetical protein